ncbi:P-loop containing nucleoside triphosphate hydrolase protein [Paraphysoderma sedebokerense]|nr:P-loop containing nucleoside triphosphate hydrolase protein [Paraphysoderma sedebokerense]
MELLDEIDLPPKLSQALHTSGYFTYAIDIFTTHPHDLSKKLRLSDSETTQLLKLVAKYLCSKPNKSYTDLYCIPSLTALELSKSNRQGKISTGDHALDSFLDGGIQWPGITEIVGGSSTGKTQLCLQLAVAAQLPQDLGGLDCGVLYISTEGRFPLTRLDQMIAKFTTQYPSLPDFSAASILSRIYIEHITDTETQNHVLQYQLPVLLSSHYNNSCSSSCPSTPPSRPIRLVIVDSIAANFRGDSMDISFTQRANMFYDLSSKLKKWADCFGVAIVVVNQVSDDFSHPPKSSSDLYSKSFGSINQNQSDHSKSESHTRIPINSITSNLGLDGVKPTLGLQWSNVITSRLILTRHDRFKSKPSFTSLLKDSLFDESREHDYNNDRGVVNSFQRCTDTNVRRSLKVVFSPCLPSFVDSGRCCEFVIDHEGVKGLEN